MNYLFIGIAGFLGAISRYYLGQFVHFWWLGVFPLGTLLTNYIGCFLLGWFTSRVTQTKAIHPYLISAIGPGFIGSFTTFSTFSVESVNLFRTDHILMGLLYVFLSLVGGILVSKAGYTAGMTPVINGEGE